MRERRASYPGLLPPGAQVARSPGEGEARCWRVRASCTPRPHPGLRWGAKPPNRLHSSGGRPTPFRRIDWRAFTRRGQRISGDISMGFKMGIVGLPVGKSTLFNALTRTANAQAANFPFCTIEPNTGEVRCAGCAPR